MDSDFLWQFKQPCFLEESYIAKIKLDEQDSRLPETFLQTDGPLFLK
jgi:hypothetical protein